MDSQWSLVATALAGYLVSHLPTIGNRIDQWFQQWLKARYGQPGPEPVSGEVKTEGVKPKE